MPRIRTIKPEFPQSESMGRISRDARLCFIELWTIADDSGRLRAASRMLASLLFPYDDDAPKLIEGWLSELEDEACIIRYESSGQHYIQICNWLVHQKIDKPSPSRFPAFVESSRILANPRECSSEDLGSRTKDLGEEGKGEDGADAPVFSREYNPSNLSTRVQSVINAWNESRAKPPYRKTVLNIPPDKMRDIAATFTAYQDEPIIGSISNYLKILSSPDHEAFPVYGTCLGFLSSGVEQYCDEAEPFERCKTGAKKTDDAWRAKAQAILDAEENN